MIAVCTISKLDVELSIANLRIPQGGFPISAIRSTAITAALCLVLAASAWAQTHQIVRNGGFETDVNGWTVNQGSLNHTTAIVHTGSGSAEMIIHPEWHVSHIVQCTDVSAIMETWPAPGGTRHLILSGYTHTNATTVSLIRMEAHFYSGLGCSELLNWYAAPPIAGPTNGWIRSSSTTAIPPRTKSIGIQLYAEGAGGETVYWDDVEAHPDSDTGLVNDVEEVEKLAPTVLPICVAVAAFGLFGLLGLMKRGRH
jgi:hypothetical protein